MEGPNKAGAAPCPWSEQEFLLTLERPIGDLAFPGLIPGCMEKRRAGREEGPLTSWIQLGLLPKATHADIPQFLLLSLPLSREIKAEESGRSEVGAGWFLAAADPASFPASICPILPCSVLQQDVEVGSPYSTLFFGCCWGPSLPLPVAQLQGYARVGVEGRAECFACHGEGGIGETGSSFGRGQRVPGYLRSPPGTQAALHSRSQLQRAGRGEGSAVVGAPSPLKVLPGPGLCPRRLRGYFLAMSPRGQDRFSQIFLFVA